MRVCLYLLLLCLCVWGRDQQVIERGERREREGGREQRGGAKSFPLVEFGIYYSRPCLALLKTLAAAA